MKKYLDGYLTVVKHADIEVESLEIQVDSTKQIPVSPQDYRTTI